MLILYETPAGYALFKGPKSIKHDEMGTLEIADQIKLKAFKKFQSTADALAAASAIVEGTLDSTLKKFIKKEVSEKLSDNKDSLLVGDSKLGASIAKKFGITVQCDAASQETMRLIRSHLPELMQGITKQQIDAMSLGLAHSLSRYKLKFTADKVDTMIIQAISLLDDLDKELNTYSMRLKEWFGWHFPEMTRVVTDNVQYAKTVLAVKAMRENINDLDAQVDLSQIISEEDEARLKQVSEISMGTEMSDEDRSSVMSLADQIVALSEYRAQLMGYIQSRTQQIAPNLTNLIGDAPLTARLIAKAGSLVNLSKAPASTIQILGAEKALFRALKGKKDTPKYGLLFGMGMVGSAGGKNKGKVARMVAAKAALCTRIDALREDANTADKTADDGKIQEVEVNGGDFGLEMRSDLENKIAKLEGNEVSKMTKKANFKTSKVNTDVKGSTYNVNSDAVNVAGKRKHDEDGGNASEGKKKQKKSKHDKHKEQN
ncbi:hypothetical protein MP228_008611 [Amoeboaphelidium protococcarum]|nr:hypothetical protein MP228_008611 [Amoeboaphelidium protococcarum]